MLNPKFVFILLNKINITFIAIVNLKHGTYMYILYNIICYTYILFCMAYVYQPINKNTVLLTLYHLIIIMINSFLKLKLLTIDKFKWSTKKYFFLNKRCNETYIEDYYVFNKILTGPSCQKRGWSDERLAYRFQNIRNTYLHIFITSMMNFLFYGVSPFSPWKHFCWHANRNSPPSHVIKVCACTWF